MDAMFKRTSYREHFDIQEEYFNPADLEYDGKKRKSAMKKHRPKILE